MSIDGAGIVRYRGFDLSSETLSSLVQGKELPKEEGPGIDFDNKESVVTNGGGAPG
ncbi:MAG: hypothetical protein ACRBG0_07890 [Lewinella sp.]|uniref:hypothetical protein n=1 Tax=Lewinella sp. TaxID=2004506 RepID=UPI003D6B7921